LHTPVERQFPNPPKIEKQVRTNPNTRICAVDVNLDTHLAVCTVQTVEGTILVFEHLGKLRPEKGTYSRRANSKRAFPISGRIFTYAKYKAWQIGIITSRVNPKNTSRECARCHAPIIRYAQGQPVEGYTTGAPLVLCPACKMRGHTDRNASLVIGQRLIARYQEKPPPPLVAERASKDAGVGVSHEEDDGSCWPFIPFRTAWKHQRVWHRSRE
jgi:transposase